MCYTDVKKVKIRLRPSAEFQQLRWKALGVCNFCEICGLKSCPTVGTLRTVVSLSMSRMTAVCE